MQTKIVPPRRTQPAANEESKNDDDDDVVSVDYTIGRPSIGLGSGRAVRPQSSMVYLELIDIFMSCLVV